MAYNPETHKQKTITFPLDMYDDIESLSITEDRNMTEEIIHLLKFAIERYPIKPDRSVLKRSHKKAKSPKK